MLAGILSALKSRSGFVESLVWLAQQTGLQGGGYVAAAFAACALVSTSTGTSFGTILICGPLLYPAGAHLCADPYPLAGAILGGATFGDSISPISDTTIASSGTQQADIGGTVISRLWYVLLSAAVAVGVALAFGGADRAAEGVSAAASANGLPMAIVPLVVLLLLPRRQHLVVSLLVGVALARNQGTKAHSRDEPHP
jgi:Na+/H+ antiporter NhaC